MNQFLLYDIEIQLSNKKKLKYHLCDSLLMFAFDKTIKDTTITGRSLQYEAILGQPWDCSLAVGLCLIKLPIVKKIVWITEFHTMTQLRDEFSQDKKTISHSICFNFVPKIKSKVRNKQSFHLPVDLYLNILIKIQLHSFLNRFHKIYCKIFLHFRSKIWCTWIW